MAGVDGSFKIWSEDNLIVFESNFGDGAAIVTDGYAGWTVVQRPKDIGITEWKGRNPMAIEIPFLLDYYLEPIKTQPGVDCENQVKNLERLCGIGNSSQPAICYVDGGGLIPHDYTIYADHRWVIEQVTWDRASEIRSRVSLRRLRCGGTITIRQYMTPNQILGKIKASDRAGSARPRRHLVKKGDNLHKIAAKYYHDANKWKRIADANNIRDHRSLFKHKWIKIP